MSASDNPFDEATAARVSDASARFAADEKWKADSLATAEAPCVVCGEMTHGGWDALEACLRALKVIA